MNSFVQYYGAKLVAASHLMLRLVGFLPTTDPQLAGTVDAIQRTLRRGGFVDRCHPVLDVDGLPPGEGDFLLHTFSMVDCLVEQGRTGEAQELFPRLSCLGNDFGRLSEQDDPDQGRIGSKVAER